MCVSQGAVWPKIARLWIDRVFYAIVITVGMIAIGQVSVSAGLVARALFPVITCRHNYVTTFVFLYFLIPYINKCVANLNRQEFTSLMVVTTLMMSLLPTICGMVKLWNNNTYVYLLWMIYVYCIGAFFRLYPVKLPWKTILVASILLVLIFVYWVEPAIPYIGKGFTTVNRNNFLMLCCSVSLFAVFLNLNCPDSKWIKWLSSSNFAILLIHDDPLIRNVLWATLLCWIPDLGISKYFGAIALVVVFGIFFVCVGIDKVTYSLFRRPLIRLLESKWQSKRNSDVS